MLVCSGNFGHLSFNHVVRRRFRLDNEYGSGADSGGPKGFKEL